MRTPIITSCINRRRFSMDRPIWQPLNDVVTADKLTELCRMHPLVVIHCGAEWNAYDTRMTALIQELKAEFQVAIGFYDMDYDDKRNWDFFRQADIATVPTLVLFENGEWRDKLVG